MSLPEYNGWANKPTWDVYVWLLNDENQWRTMMQKANDFKGEIYDFANWLREYIESESPLADDASLYSDLLWFSMAHINYDELAENLSEEVVVAYRFVCTKCGNVWESEDEDDVWCRVCDSPDENDCEEITYGEQNGK